MPEDITYLYAKAVEEGGSVRELVLNRIGHIPHNVPELDENDPKIIKFNMMREKLRLDLELDQHPERASSAPTSPSASRGGGSTPRSKKWFPLIGGNNSPRYEKSAISPSSPVSRATSDALVNTNWDSPAASKRRTYEAALAASKPGNGWGRSIGRLASLALSNIKLKKSKADQVNPNRLGCSKELDVSQTRSEGAERAMYAMEWEMSRSQSSM
mmetsp:Transcript_18018/g.35214  ORF Transcript_18018/g.35214 Transcript_18018/m.35214 type:complete len:214 (-) Transcript_18018:179-820(-)